ncbi:serine/threonine-protein kinase [Streptomyces sp. NPDC089799]|uniref:serine/threonine-protein kinase n=1 Tax=Streptomyces sp. NPDC089799 TaxID=3155066 RepID=UPI00342E8CFB
MSDIGSTGRVRPALPGDPSRIGPYRVMGRLGSGGMGTVHAALAPDGARVAVKVVHQAQAEDPEFRARFRREVQLSARVQGPCLLPLLAADPEAAAPWLATEYAPGPTLDRHVAAYGPLTGGTLYAFATGTAQALAAIHSAGVVHRDVKPQNVILGPAGPRVLDFGIAHAADGTSVTRTGVMTGTPGWISPEHYRTGSTGPEGDVFAWAALVAYAATGRPPFGTGAPDVVAFRVLSGEADLDGVPADLRGTLERALAKAPADRPTAAAAAGLCSGPLASQSTRVLPAGPADPTLVGSLIGAAWSVPPPDDPAWHPAAPAGGARRRLPLAVAAAAAAVGGLAGAVLAVLPSEPAGSAAPATGTSAAAPAGSAAPASASAPPPTGVQAPPASPAAARTGEATLATWRESRPARGQEENDAYGAMGTGAWLDAVTYPDQTRTITFHKDRGEVYVAMAGHPLPPVAVQEVSRIACLGLQDLVRSYPGLPYRSYVVVDTAATGGPGIVWEDDFRRNTECRTSVTQQPASPAATGRESSWTPDMSGLGEAMVPSSDQAEIRVAHHADIAVQDAWRAAGGEPLAPADMSVGFDGGSGVMYVWVTRPGTGQGVLDRWAADAAGLACRALDAESRSRPEWRYRRYAVALVGASGGSFLRWGSSGGCAG